MKKMTRVLALVLVVVMILGIVPPLEVKAEDYIISIHTAEEFMAIAENSGGSYRLENSIQLGSIQPLGEFRGSLDGNGHTVSFSQSYSSGIRSYGLFTRINGAQISNLNVSGNISLNISDSGSYYVGILAGSVSGGSLGGGNISGSVNISGSAGNVVIGGAAGEAGYGYHMQDVTLSMHVSANTGGDQSCSYFGTVTGGIANGCFIDGSVNMSGNINTVQLLPNGNDNNVSQNVTVESQDDVSVTGINGGERNKLYGSFHVTATGGSVVALDGGAGNKFEGDIFTTGAGACMADSVRGAEVSGNITVMEGAATGMRYCRNSTMNGNITVNKNSGGTIYGMYKCNESILNGNITYDAVGLCRIYAAYDSDHVQVNGSMSLNQKRSGSGSYNNGGVYGLIECPNSGFNGSLHAKGDDVHAVGACNAGYDVVNADITVESQVHSSASGVGDNSSFNGTITNKNGGISACGNSSIAKGTLTGQSVTTSGSGSYFSGTVTARYNGGENSYAGVSIGYAADAAVTVEGGKHGAHFSMGSYFGGTANVSAEDGYVTANCHYGKNVSMSHRASGVSSDSATVLGDRETHGEVYWHRNAAEYGHPKNGCDGYIYFGWHTYLHRCYDTILGVAYSEAPVSNLSDVDWPNGIDPVNGTFEPDRDPVDYVLKVSVGGMDCYNYRLSIGGGWQYPDESGCVAVTQGPAVISPLVVELKNQDGSYSRVLTYSSYYPVPNMVNTILLEPQLDKIAFSFMDAGYSGREAGEKWGGIKAEIFGKEVPLVDCPMEIDLSVLDYQITLEEKKLGENRWGYSFSLGKTEDVGSLDADVVKVLKKQVVRFAGAEMSIGGKFYVEAAFDPNVNLWHVVGGNFGVEAEIGKDFTYYIYGPIYVNFGVHGGGTGNGGVIQIAENDSVDSVKFAPDGQVSLSTGAELAVGAGLRSIDFYAEGGGEGEAEWLWRLPHREGRDSVTVQINYNGFVTYRYMWGGTKITFQEGSYQLWPFEEFIPRQLTEESFSVLPRTYLSAGSAQGNGAQARTLVRGNGFTSLSGGNAYPYSQVQLLGLDDGRFVLLYTDDDISRGDADRSALRARIGTEVDGQIAWGEAVTIEDDGTGDYAFTACASYDQVAVVWQDTDKTFGSGEGVDLEDAAAHIDLTQAVLDCSGGVPQVTRTAALTSGSGQPESLPMIFYHADSNGETLRTAWTTSTAKSPISADENTKYTLWVSEAFGQAGQKVKDNMPYVTGIALFADELLWSTQVGNSSDLWYRDGAGNVSQQKESGIANLQSVGHRYIFTEDDQLMGGEWNFASCGLQSVSEYNRNVLRLTSTGEIYYVQPGLENSQVYWLDDGASRLAGEYSGYLSSWDAANHQIVTVLRTGFGESDTASLISQPRQDIERLVLDVVCENQEAIPGSYVTIYVDAQNQGTWDYGELFTQVAMDDGTVLYEKTHNQALKAREKTDLELLFQIPEGFTSQEVTLTVGSASQRVFLGGTNLGIDAQWSQYNPGGVNVIVENTGNAEASGTITVSDAAGAVLASQDVALAQGEARQIWMDFGKVYTEATEVTVSLAEAEDALYSGDNQVTVTVYASESGNEEQDPEDGTQDPGGNEQPPSDGTQTPNEPSAPDTPSTPGEPSEPGSWINPFVDVDERMFCYDPVLWAYYNGITTGKDETHFNPSGNCTRSQVVTFLWRAAGEPEPESMENPFPDVPEGKFYTKAVLWAVEQGITNGFKDGSFGPNKTCTRGQIVTFLWRYMDQPEPKSMENPFPDVDTGAYYGKAVLWAVENGITTGYKDGTFGPNKTCKRDQIVTFLYRAMVK